MAHPSGSGPTRGSRSRRVFARHLGTAVVIWIVMTGVGLAIGMAGYMAFEGMTVVDAFMNAAMILSGMGPAAGLATDAGKIFAGAYALFSGLIVVIATGFVLAPIVHRVLHRFHIEDGDRADD